MSNKYQLAFQKIDELKPVLSETGQGESRDLQSTLVAKKLQNYGLTWGEARVYIYLLGKPPLPARVISNDLDIHRVDTYRKLRELEERGLVELHLGSPKKFSAIVPEMAISSLVHRAEARVVSLKQYSKDFQRELEEIENYNNLQSLSRNLNLSLDKERYRLVMGRERLYKEIHNMLRNSKKEVLRILSANGIKRTFHASFVQDYVNAKTRGVRIRMISEITDQNRTEAKKLSKLLELRHLKDVHMRFAVVDQRYTILSVKFDDANMTDRSGADSYLFSNDPRFAEASRFLFEHLWSTAEEPTF